MRIRKTLLIVWSSKSSVFSNALSYWMFVMMCDIVCTWFPKFHFLRVCILEGWMGVPKHLQQAGNTGWGGSPLLGAVGTAGHVRKTALWHWESQKIKGECRKWLPSPAFHCVTFKQPIRIRWTYEKKIVNCKRGCKRQEMRWELLINCVVQ